MKRRVRSVAGDFLLEEKEVIESEIFENVEEFLESRDEGEDLSILDTEELARITGLGRKDIHERQVEAAREHTRRKIEDARSRDQVLVQAVRALEDLDEINNEMSERLRPWYSVFDPEFPEEVQDNEEFARRVSEDIRSPGGGMEMTGRDREMLESFASSLDDSHGLREELEVYIGEVAAEVAPNLSSVLGEVLAARVISLAGSLEKLAKMPSSTIQVLGAEKAMFRHMKGEGKPPKHGVLFVHPLVRKAGGSRGEMARFIANKAAIAARLDHFGGDFKGEELEEEVVERFEEVRG